MLVSFVMYLCYCYKLFKVINIDDDHPHNSKQIRSEKTMIQQKINDLIGEDNVQPQLSLNNEEC